MAFSFGHTGVSCITAMKRLGTPTACRKILTAAPRRCAATASPILVQWSSVVERLSSRMNRSRLERTG